MGSVDELRLGLAASGPLLLQVLVLVLGFRLHRCEFVWWLLLLSLAQFSFRWSNRASDPNSDWMLPPRIWVGLMDAFKWWLECFQSKSTGWSHLPPPPHLPPSLLCLCVKTHIQGYVNTHTPRLPPRLCLACSHASAVWGWFRGPYKWEGCKWRQKPETNHSTAASRFPLKLQKWREAAEQWKIYTHSILSERFWLILSDCQGCEYQGMDRNI